ncbi:major allergen Can f 1-like [Lepus europaeus]|uniref:major allergen Can f 1-like n=1 Tax=Lepus europaeus TaxID=9983 RepID=UPI002B4838A7|nr:major allergen Can f 1-like [Lepus europaeus]
MQTLLLAFGFGLLVVLQAQDPLDVGTENQAPSGTLYLKAMALDKEISELKPDSVGPVTIVAQDGGSLEVTLSSVTKGQCYRLSTVLEKTEQPGVYLAFEGRTTVQVTQMKEKDHWVFQCQGEIHGQRFKHAKLIGKDPENNPAALAEFEQLVKERGLNSETILVLTQGGARPVPRPLQNPPLTLPSS